MHAFRVAYDGRPYYGFQRQPEVPTVEDALFDALHRLDVLADDAEATADDADAAVPTDYAAAGRTDAGVSARAQTVAFDAPGWLTPAAWNSELPADVRVWASDEVPDDFHATHDARSRAYVYHLSAPDADDDRAIDAMDALAGEHDFHDLTPDETGTVRALETDLERDGEFLVLRFRADGFARHMVRRLVALVESIACGTAGLDRVDRVLADETLSGPDAVATAPAHPLVLWDVAYDVDFAVDDEAAASARSVFADRRVEHLTNARVAGTILDGL